MLKSIITGLTLLLIMSSASMSLPKLVPVTGSENAANWSSNNDGGLISITEEKVADSSKKPSLHLKFNREGYEWGNALIHTSLPEDTVSIVFDLHVKSAEAGAMLSIWLMEKDGDGYHVFVKPDDKMLSDVSKYLIRCSTPLSAFTFDPRGNKIPQILTVDKMLIGINSGKADIYVSNVAFLTIKASKGIQLNKTENLEINRTAKGSIAILNDSFRGSIGQSDPETLAASLKSSGYGITMLKSGDIADPAILNTKNFDCLILPYGPEYPADAREPIKVYLKSGGSFFSTGGYTFDTPCVMNSDGVMTPADNLVTAKDIANGDVSGKPMNTRNGAMGDTLGLNPDQIGVFDPSYILNDVKCISAVKEQSVIPITYSHRKAVVGYAASALLGSNNPVFPDKWGRHIPLIEGTDYQGRSKGPAGAIAFNYDGPYAKSSWAFFGVTDVNLFGKYDESMLPYLPKIIDALLAKRFLHSMQTDLACYKSGEAVRVSCNAANYGKSEAKAQVLISIFDEHGKVPISTIKSSIELNSRSDQSVKAVFKSDGFKGGLYRIKAVLQVGDKVVDQMEAGFMVYMPVGQPKGFDMTFKENYFHDGSRPLLLSGTNFTGQVFYAIDENPLVWDRDLQRMNENGLNVARVVHFSPFVTSSPGKISAKPMDLNIDKLPISIERKFDAFVQLCRKHKIIVFLTTHDWMELGLTDEELAAQKRYLHLIADRYKDTPGFMVDIQNEPNINMPTVSEAKNQPVHIVKLWNDYLQGKYGSDDALKSAWTITSPEAKLGNIQLYAGSDDWADMRTFDADMFRNVQINRWIKENADGARLGNPKMPVAVGFLQEFWSLNKLTTMEYLDFANMHSYTPIETLRVDFKLFDRRFEGKSVSEGEYGAYNDHQLRVSGVDNPVQEYDRYLRTGHYLFGEGGSFISNWCWKDMNDVVFPWGLNYTCDGPGKNLLKAYRNQSLLFRQIRPIYTPQKVYLVVPINSMMGGKTGYTTGLLYKYVDALFDLRVDFGVIDDEHLSMLPPSAEVLIYPAAFAVPDKAYTQLQEFVNKGGRLFISGDIGYNPLRQRTLGNRLEELCGVRFVSTKHQPGAGEGALIDVERITALDDSGIFANSVGQGKVFYSPDLMSGINGNLLKNAFVGSKLTVPASAGHAFLIPEDDGAQSIILVNPKPSTITVAVDGPNGQKIEIELVENGVGMVRFDKSGKLAAIEFQNQAKIGGKVIRGKGHFAVSSLDGKGIMESNSLVILPFDGSSLNLSWINKKENLIVRSFDLIDGIAMKLYEEKPGTMSIQSGKRFDILIVSTKSQLDSLQEKIIKELKLQ